MTAHKAAAGHGKTGLCGGRIGKHGHIAAVGAGCAVCNNCVIADSQGAVQLDITSSLGNTLFHTSRAAQLQLGAAAYPEITALAGGIAAGNQTTGHIKGTQVQVHIAAIGDSCTVGNGAAGHVECTAAHINISAPGTCVATADGTGS